ncbi:transposase, partial [Massilia sp. TWR1-2-2]|uniref:transposase n=1 Tax=Massilia sp. TWR1-2-2 TaxID=2804584 RepID=UPI003CF42A54
MQEIRTDSEFRLVGTGTGRDGRRRYEAESKRSLARACLQPGASLAGMALKHGVNANLLRKWVVAYQLAPDVPAAPDAAPLS